MLSQSDKSSETVAGNASARIGIGFDDEGLIRQVGRTHSFFDAQRKTVSGCNTRRLPRRSTKLRRLVAALSESRDHGLSRSFVGCRSSPRTTEAVRRTLCHAGTHTVDPRNPGAIAEFEVDLLDRFPERVDRSGRY